MKEKHGALHASWRGLENTVYLEAVLPLRAAALGAFSFVLLFFSFSGRCLYGNVIFNFLKTCLSGVNSYFEVRVFCIMFSGHLDSVLNGTKGKTLWAFCVQCGHTRNNYSGWKPTREGSQFLKSPGNGMWLSCVILDNYHLI